MSNRKLIRTTLAEVKGKERPPVVQPRERSNGTPHRDSDGGGRDGGRDGGGGRGERRDTSHRPQQRPAAPQARKRVPPPMETNAELFYYKKQIDSHTPMVIVLQDGEEIEGTIEWYDRGALKVNRTNAPNLLLLKRNIKYMFKAEDRVTEAEA